jgi:hypothetical protein
MSGFGDACLSRAAVDKKLLRQKTNGLLVIEFLRLLAPTFRLIGDASTIRKFDQFFSD